MRGATGPVRGRRVVLLALALTIGASAPPGFAQPGDGEPWFRVALIAFGHLDAAGTLATTGEHPAVAPVPGLPAGHGALGEAPPEPGEDPVARALAAGTDLRAALQLVWFDHGVRPWTLRAVHALEDVERAMARQLGSRDLAAALNPGAPVYAPSPGVPDRPTPLAPGAVPDPAGTTAPAGAAPGNDPEGLPVARPAFVALERDATVLGPAWTRLRGSRGYRPFLFAAWDQPVPEAAVTRLFLEEAPLTLRLELRRGRFLHVSGEAWLDPSALPDLAPHVEALPEKRGRTGTPGASEAPARAAGLRQPRPPRVLWRFERRLRSDETHYLDHPVLGLLIHIAPVRPPDAP